MNTKTDYEILLEELNNLSDKWHKRLDYHATEGKKDIHDSYLCATIVYELERAKQEASNKIAEMRQQNYFASKKDLTLQPSPHNIASNITEEEACRAGRNTSAD